MRRIGGDGHSRRRFLKTGVAAVGSLALAGCTDGGEPTGTPRRESASLGSFRGSGAGARPDLSGPRIDDLEPLAGDLSIYLGGGEGGLYVDLLERLQEIYPDFTPEPRQAPSTQLANTILEESSGGSSSADVFWAVDAGSLGVVAGDGITRSVSGETVENVPGKFRPDDQWVGVAGRARSVPYNTDELSADDVPDSVLAFPETDALAGSMGWAPTYGAFQSFVTAMRLLEGEDRTRQWLESMQDAGTRTYPDEFLVSNAVADGEIAAGFANHYYALRVQAARSASPIELAFTSGDSGALINVSGAAVIDDTERATMAERFVRHLLTVEAQEFFATHTFAYPMIPEVPPVGGLPGIDELNPPDLDLRELSNVEPTLDLLREVGLL
jgi:iron(III) transport system substrate-binding protein